MKYLFKKLLAPRQLEYLTIDCNFKVVDFSGGIQRFAEPWTRVEIGTDSRLTFPELVGLESILRSLFLQDLPHFQIKNIQRHEIYFDLIFFADNEHGEMSIILVFEDITQRILLEQTLAQRTNETLLLMEALSNSKEYLRQIIDRMAEVLIVTTEAGIIKMANYTIQNLLGYSETELIGKNIIQLSIDNLQITLGKLKISLKTRSGTEITIDFTCTSIPINAYHHEWIFSGIAPDFISD